MRRWTLCSLLLLGLLLTACGGAAAPDPAPPAAAPTPTPDEAMPAEVTTPVTDEVTAPPKETPVEEQPTAAPDEPADETEAIINSVLAQLSAETGIPTSGLSVTSIEPVDWPNPALGCPEPGQMYADVIVPGYRLLVEANGEIFDVGTDAEGSRIAVCDKTL